MANLIDYLDWRGDLPFCSETFTTVDMLILSQIVYCPLENIPEGEFGKPFSEYFNLIYPRGIPEGATFVNKEMFDFCRKAASTLHFGSMKLERFVSDWDAEKEIQFAAAVFSAGDTLMIAFRGTDTTVIGWKEDFNMCFASPVPSQVEAVKLLDSMDFTGKKVYICGHSKGGNLAMYSGTYCRNQDAITAIYSFDGPGFDDGTMDTVLWAAVKDRVFSYIPEASIVGFLMGYCRDYMVVKSDSAGILQHNPFNWHIMGGGFCQASGNSFSSRLINETMHSFLDSCTREHRKVFVETLFRIVEASHADDAKDLISGLAMHVGELRQVIAQVPEEDRRMLMELGRNFSESSSRSFWSLVRSL